MKILLLNSLGHSHNGWFDSRQALVSVIEILKEASIGVDVQEVVSLTELESLLARTERDTLIWSNAYLVNDGPTKQVWLNDRIEARGLPLLGSGGQTLRDVLNKDLCQNKLAAAGIPVPRFAVFSQDQLEELELHLRRCGIGFPMVLKPTAESGSVGVALAHSGGEAAEIGRSILSKFPHGKLIVEEFLPSNDITCGFLQMGSETLLMPTAYIVHSTPGQHNILDRTQRLRTWDGSDKVSTVITDESIVNQLKEHIPTIAKTLKLGGVTRVDGRLDVSGKLRFFDVNGLPALSFPDSVMVKQCSSCFSDHPPATVFRALIHTLVIHAAYRYGFEVPEALSDLHLLSMSSPAVHRVKGQE